MRPDVVGAEVPTIVVSWARLEPLALPHPQPRRADAAVSGCLSFDEPEQR